MSGLSSKQKIVTWILQLIAAGILTKASLGKFTGVDIALFIFDQTGMGPTGRYIIGLIEAFAALLLLTPNISHLGALLGFGTMVGALIAHITGPGIEVNEDGGMLIMMMVIVIVTTATVMYMRRKDLPMIGQLFQ